MPVQPCVMRPMRSTPVASTTTSEAPEFASMPRCVVCHGLGTPSSALYWHIGETTMRLVSSSSLILYGENSALVMGLSDWKGVACGGALGSRREMASGGGQVNRATASASVCARGTSESTIMNSSGVCALPPTGPTAQIVGVPTPEVKPESAQPPVNSPSTFRERSFAQAA